MARGTQSKELITKAILQVFPGSFIDTDGKTVRIPTTVEGEPIEIKVGLTAAKDLVCGKACSEESIGSAEPQNREMTEEEVKAVKDIIEKLGL